MFHVFAKIAFMLCWLGFALGLAIERPGSSQAKAERLTAIHAAQGLLARPFDPHTAAAYWDSYDDVAQDNFYGRSGPLGLRGAFLHYESQGRRQGRAWGKP